MGYTIGMPSIKLNNVGQKSKHCGSFKKVAEEALAERLGLDLDINKELTSQNIYKGFKTAKELMQYSVKHIEELDFNRPEGTRKIRADAVVMCGTILKPPAEMMMNLSREQQQKFLEDAVEDFSKIVREDNVKSVVLHFDERVPHAHVFWEPMTEDGRLCAKEMHNLKFFGRLNREMPEMLRKQGWSIDNCQAYDKAEEDKKREEMGEEKYREYRKEKRKNRGKDSNTFKSEAEKNLQEINSQISQKTEELDGINAQIKELKEQEQESERFLEENEELRRFVQRETEKAKSELAEVQEQTQGARAELAEVQEQTQTAKSELVAAIEIPPRPVEKPLVQKPEKPKDPRTVSGWTKQDYQEYKGILARWEKECKSIDRQNAEIEKQNALIRQQQAEWDSKYNLLQRVQEVHKEQQRTAEQQNQTAILQSQNSKKLKKDRAELEQEKRTLPQKAQAMAMDILRRMERFTELTKINAAWKQRYQQIFGKQYDERIDNHDRTTIKAEQDVRNGTKPQQPERDG